MADKNDMSLSRNSNPFGRTYTGTAKPLSFEEFAEFQPER